MWSNLLANLMDALIHKEITATSGYEIIALYEEAIQQEEPILYVVHILTCEDGPIQSVIDHKNLYRRLTAVRLTTDEDPSKPSI